MPLKSLIATHLAALSATCILRRFAQTTRIPSPIALRLTVLGSGTTPLDVYWVPEFDTIEKLGMGLLALS